MNKRGISLIVLVITIIIIIVLSGVVILGLKNTDIINNAQIATLLNNRKVLEDSISLKYNSYNITKPLDYDYTIEEFILGSIHDSTRIVEKKEDKLTSFLVKNNGKDTLVYKLDEELCLKKEINYPSNIPEGSFWGTTSDGEVILVFNANASMPNWTNGNDEIFEEQDCLVKIENEKKEPTLNDTLEAVSADMFVYSTSFNGEVMITGINSDYSGLVPSEIKFPSIAPDGSLIIGISDNVFQNNSNIRKVVIPEGMTTLRANVFTGCNNLNEVYLPSTLNSINASSASPFYNCNNIEKITVPNFMISNVSSNISNVFTSSKSKIKEVEFCNEITSIVVNTFSDFTSLENITIPDTVTTIGTKAFYNCTSLEGELIIPKNVTDIGNFAFEGCSKITSVTFQAGSNLKNIGSNAFYSLDLIKNVKIPEGVEVVSSNAFGKCTSIKEVYLPSTLTTISASSASPFYECTNIERITIPNLMVSNTSYNPGNVFLSSKNVISEIKFSNDITNISENCFSEFISLKNITIPQTVETIGNKAFFRCTALTSDIVIPKNVSYIGEFAFYECSKIKSLEFASESKLIKIGNNAFYNLQSIESIKLPEGVQEIGSEAFRKCINVNEVYLPSTLNNISASSASPFYECGNIQKITVPNYMMINWSCYPSNVFVSAKNKINEVKFSDNITKIVANSFSDFTALDEITIPSSVTEIENNAFLNCTSLEKIIYSGSAIGNPWGAPSAVVVIE